jgi:glycosyltransferase involved in cell wall biosynthesis
MRACFICHSARGLVGGHTGGAERQVALLARSFAARGHDVSFVVPGLQEDPGTYDGVQLASGWDDARGLRVARSVTYRAPRLHRVLAQRGADLYYVRGRAHFTPVVMWAARSAGAVSVLGLANDRDLLPDAGRLPYGLGDGPFGRLAERIEYQYFLRGALQRADWIVTQHGGQDELCARMGLRHARIPNIVGVPAAMADAEPRYDAIWIGNVHREERRRKGLDEFVALTGLEPDLRFAVAGGFSAPAAKAALAVLQRRPNVTVLGILDHETTLAAIAASRVVVNTSAWEGLSNVMLEGWALGRPSVTLSVDPNGLLSAGRLGATAGGDLELLRARLRRLIEDDAERRAIGERAISYVAATHGADAIAARYEALVSTAPAGKRRPR